MTALSTHKDLELDLISQLFNSKPFIMKTILKFILLILFINITFIVKSQVVTSYEIQNNSPCNVTFDYKIFDQTGCGSCENVQNIVVTANNSYFINSFGGSCSSSTQACDIRITITNLGGPVNLVFDSSSAATNPNSIGPIGGCISTTGNVVWSNNILSLNP